MSEKVHIFHIHANYCPENLEAMTEEQGESFHQDTYKNNRKDTRDARIPTCWQTISGLRKRLLVVDTPEKTQKRQFLD